MKISRILRSAEFGLYERWIEMSKQEYYRWRSAMRKMGYPVSCILCIMYQHKGKRTFGHKGPDGTSGAIRHSKD